MVFILPINQYMQTINHGIYTYNQPIYVKNQPMVFILTINQYIPTIYINHRGPVKSNIKNDLNGNFTIKIGRFFSVNESNL